MTRVLGLDVSKRSVVACLLTERPDEPKQIYYKHNFYSINADASGIKQLLSLKPDIALIEPTGTNYSRLWVETLIRSQVTVKFVGHKELRSYRSSHLGLPDKDDQADALALACYFFDYKSPRRYLVIRDATTSKIRELILRLHHLSRIQNAIKNRIRQDLAWQFPEIALVRTTKPVHLIDTVPLLWGWLAGERESKKYDRLYEQSVGIGLTEKTKLHAERLCHLIKEEYQIEIELFKLLQLKQFIPYRRAFDAFAFGLRTKAMILSQIYPIDNFLNDNNKPIVEFYKSHKTGKSTKRRISERRFQKILGLAPTQESSGDKKKSRTGTGSSLCREAFFLWLFTSVEPRQKRKKPIIKKLGEILDKEKKGGRPVRLARSRVCARACKMLFNQIVKEVNEYEK